jgi:hypothetical protein
MALLRALPVTFETQSTQSAQRELEIESTKGHKMLIGVALKNSDLI